MQIYNDIKNHGLLNQLARYIEERNAIFIVAHGKIENRAYADFTTEAFSQIIQDLGGCSLFLVNQAGLSLSSPFLAAEVETATRTASLKFLVDLTPQAENGHASPFYSKLTGAVATQFFAGTDQADRLWVPFSLEKTVGRGVLLEPAENGHFLVRA